MKSQRYRRLRVIIAANAFKDCYAPLESAKVIDRVLKDIYPNILDTHYCPMADGGEHSLEIAEYYGFGKKYWAHGITHATGKKIAVPYLINNKGEALLASSECLKVSKENDKLRNPELLTTYGLGELLLRVISRHNLKKIYLALGGTSTSDAGLGFLQALQIINAPKILTGGNLSDFRKLKIKNAAHLPNNLKIIALCDAKASLSDIKVPLSMKIGNHYAKEKKSICQRVFRNTQFVAKKIKPKQNFKPFYGVAGGLPIGLQLLPNIEIREGAPFFLKLSRLDALLKTHTVVITGEGRLDNSLLGKGPIYVCKLARKSRTPVIYVCGSVDKKFSFKFKSNRCTNLPKSLIACGVFELVCSSPKHTSRSIKVLKRNTEKGLTRGLRALSYIFNDERTKK